MIGLAKARTRASTARLLVLALLASLLSLVPFPSQSETASAATVNAGTCAAAGVSGGGVTITPSHGQVFYIDTGQGQRVNAAYVGYRVTSSANLSDVWVKLDNFGSQIVQLANPLDEVMQVGALNSGNSRAGVAYFLLKAERPTTTAQTHRVSIFNGNPSAPGNEAIATCTFSFSTVKETIKASANKVIDVTSVNAGVIGGELVVTHEGATGTIGSGLSSPDKDVIWVSPASNTSWPTRAYRLKKVKIEYFDNKTATGTVGLTKNDELLLRPAINSIGNNKTPSSYRATYTFEIIGRGSGAVAPVAQIASGTQIKHTDMSGFYNADGTGKFTVSTAQASVNLKVEKFGSGVTVEGGQLKIRYRIKATNTGTTSVTVDSLEDTADSALYLETSSVTSSAATFSAPFSSSAGAGKLSWKFQGPFALSGGSSVEFSYKMVAPCSDGVYSYSNSAVARVGDLSIGLSAGAFQQVVSSLNLSSASGCTVVASSQTQSTQSFPVEVTTGTAKSVTTNSGTVTGAVDSNGQADIDIYCDYSTEPDLAGYNSATPAIPGSGKTSASLDPIVVECNLTNLRPGTTYYYRVRAGSNAGAILSFTTPPEVFTTPTARTDSITNMSEVGSGGNATVNVTLNGTVNPRGVITRARYEYKRVNSTACDIYSGASVVSEPKLDVDASDNKIDLVLSGGYETVVSYDITGLVKGAKYCYTILADYPDTYANTLNGSWVYFESTGKNPPTAITLPATSITQTSATLPGTVQKGTDNATSKICISSTAPTTSIITGCTAQDTTPSSINSTSVTDVSLSVTGLTGGTRYYFQVIATDGTNTVYANIEEFVTPGPPVATTEDATEVTYDSAHINGSVAANGAITDAFFCISTSAAVTNGFMNHCASANTLSPAVATQIPADSTGVRYAHITGLLGTTTYYFQIIGRNSNGTAYGQVLSFSTPVAPSAPAATTDNPTSVAPTSATLNGTVSAGNATTQTKFCWKEESSSAACELVSATPTNLTGNSGTPVEYSLTGLTPNTTYSYQVLGQNSVTTSYGLFVTFRTPSLPPAATTSAATNIGEDSANINGSVSAGYQTGSVYFCYGTSQSAVSASNCATHAATPGSANGNSSTDVSKNLTGLSSGTTYYFKVLINTPHNGGTTVSGQVLSFSTLVPVVAPTAITHPPISYSHEAATLSGTVTAGNANGTVTFCIGRQQDLSDCVTQSAGVKTGNTPTSVSAFVSALTSSATYWYRVTITNANSTAHGATVSFSTEAEPVFGGLSDPSSSPTATPSSSPSASPSASPSSSPSTSSTTEASPSPNSDPCQPVASTTSITPGLYSRLIGYLVDFLTNAGQLTASFAGGVLQSPLAELISASSIPNPLQSAAAMDALTSFDFRATVLSTVAKAVPRMPNAKDILNASEIQLSPGSTPGTIEISSIDNEALYLDYLASNDPFISTLYSGADFNKPGVWEALGYGMLCWKLEPFSETSYVLPNPIQLPPGTEAGDWRYSAVIVKAGSLTSRSDTYQTDTIFVAPQGGTMVWPDVNVNGIYDPGGRGGDKAISHIIFCVTKGLSKPTTAATTSPATSPSASQTSSPAPTSSSTPVVTPTPTQSSTVTPTPTTSSASPSATPSPSTTLASCPTPTPTQSPTLAPRDPRPNPTQSPILILFNPPTNSPSPSPTPSGSSSPSPSPSTSPSPSGTPSPTPTNSSTPTPTTTSPSPTGTASPTPTNSSTPTPTQTATPLPSPSVTLDSGEVLCQPEGSNGVAMVLTNGRDRLCYQTTTLAFFRAASVIPADLEDAGSEGELAATGFDSVFWLFIAGLLGISGAMMLAVGRRRED